MENIVIKLPKEYLDRMKTQLKGEFENYLDSLACPAIRGLRVNLNKISVEDFLARTKFNVSKLPFADDGFILCSDEKVGDSFDHISGLYYMQEPSSMLAVISSGIQFDDRPLKVLDLCASPGGKTGQIASRISNDSVLISNEIIYSRAEVLYSNVERLGLRNVVTLNEKPENLLNFEGYFDYVFVDAPCSGEGMFRKNPETIGEWSSENVKMCAERQKEILKIATKLVCTGGKLVYSTCTFSNDEDEDIVRWFTKNYNFKLIDVPEEIKNVTVASNANISNADFARKFYPYKSSGEGQFVAVFKNFGETTSNSNYKKKHFKSIIEIGRLEKSIIDDFVKNNLKCELDGKLFKVGNNIFLVPETFDAHLITVLDELKFCSLGIKLGTIQKDRFEPNHNMFMALENLFKEKVELSSEDAKRYLHGEELSTILNFKGYVAVTINGYCIGGARAVQGKLKNLYPRGLRI